MRVFLVLLMLLPGLARAEGEKAGDFDYYMLALSWSPSWCALEGDARNADQCDDRHDHGFTLHGLWPEYEDGYPSFCRTSQRDPSRSDTRAMSDIMGSGGLAWHQWKKHGRCSGLSSDDYFALSREAYDSVNRPEIFRQLDREVSVPPKVIEEAFLEANKTMSPNGITVTCRDAAVQEVRICLTKNLEPRNCAYRAARDCSARSITMAPIR